MQCSCLVLSRLALKVRLEGDDGGTGLGCPTIRAALGQRRMLRGQMKALAMLGAEHRGTMALEEQFIYFSGLRKQTFFLPSYCPCWLFGDDESQHPFALTVQWGYWRAEVVAAGFML